ncbi:hypothetical protein JCM19274_2756 [Algibacter lectus]|uniref:BIG2 domain-containing protein n=1 Tax=Algibacter lectus TaxID=221126 RepID=A0A090WY82_9FLAO|nr:Ig-like domain-containing protein [Algibacter lectus]GAL82045.1 hypothetical protein JCM19274_2756 [Algibacter lectus]
MQVALRDYSKIEVGEYTETFTNLVNDGTAMTKDFTGDNDIVWHILDATYATDQGSGASVSIETGVVTSEPISAGIKNLSVNLYNKDNTDNKTVKVGLYVNGTLVGTSENNSNNEVYTYSISDVDLNGKVAIEIRNLSDTTSPVVIDNISWETMPEIIIPVESITLSETELSIEQYLTRQLTATYTPENITDLQVKWSSSNPSIASINQDGEITALSPGETLITLIANPGNKMASCSVTVTEVVDETYTETFNNIQKTGWVNETYTGDNGFLWSANGKAVTGYINSTTGLYNKNTNIATSEAIPGGIASFSISCKNKWTGGRASTIELLINGDLVGSSTTTTDNVNYTFEVNEINIPGDIVLNIRIGNETIAIDNITWTSFKGISLSTNKTEGINASNIYPNPSTGKFSFKNLKDTDAIKVYSAQGKLILDQKVSNSDTSINLEGHPAGLYLVIMQYNNQTIQSKKLIIK